MKVLAQVLPLWLILSIGCHDGGKIDLQSKYRQYPVVSQKFQQFVRDESAIFLSFLENGKHFSKSSGSFSNPGSFEFSLKNEKYYFDNSIGWYLTQKGSDNDSIQSESFSISGYKFINANIALRFAAYYSARNFPESGVNDDVFVFAQTYDLTTGQSVEYYPDYFSNPRIFLRQKGSTFIVEFDNVNFLKAFYGTPMIKGDVFFNKMVVTLKMECSDFNYENKS